MLLSTQQVGGTFCIQKEVSQMFMKMLKGKFIRLFVYQFFCELRSVPLQTGPVYDDYVP